MKRLDQSIGITPITIKRAAYYLSLGVGEYFPEHPHFDKVVVHKLYDVMPNPHNDSEWSIGIRVDFYLNQRIVRWIEFGCRLTGAGGDPIFRKVEDHEEFSCDTSSDGG